MWVILMMIWVLRVRFGKVYKQGSATFIEVINTSATLPADISYCHIRGAKYYE
jgi:hypothetical protein